MKIAENFYRNIPIEKRKIVEERLIEFAETIPTAKSLSDIPNSFWIRKIRGTDRFKFRVNSGDRILFEFDEDNNICFLSFQTHDKQILDANNNKTIRFEEFIINTDEYVESSIDRSIDYYAKYELQANLLQLRQDIVVEDEDITLIIEDPLFKEENYLTNQQFDILKKTEEISIVLGCAGSGKTSIAIRRLMLNQELKKETIYLTNSNFLNNQVKEDFMKIAKNDKGISFYSLQSLYEIFIDQNINVIYYTDFLKWYINNNLNENQIDISPNTIFLEINTILKGVTDERILSKEEYLSLESHFTSYDKKYIYHIASIYQKWLEDNNYYDLNDLSKMINPTINFNKDIIVDEVQDFTESQLKSILNLKGKNNSIIFFGDKYQTTQNYLFSLRNLKSIMHNNGYHYQISYLTDNFRSGDETVKFLNRVKAEKAICRKTSTFMLENAVRTSQKPEVLYSTNDFEKIKTKINQDTTAIIVVSTEKDKDSLSEKGFLRVFNIHDIQGLQYSKVYCYNLFINYEKQYSKSNHGHSMSKMDSILFNFIYLASSRSINRLVFVEENESSLSKKFNENINKINMEKLLKEKSNVSSKNDWVTEGYRLKRLGKYEQAIEAFKMGDNEREAKICNAILTRKLDYQLSKDYQVIFRFNWNVKSVDEMSNALIYLREKHNFSIRGNIIHYVIEPNRLSQKLSQKKYFIHEEQEVYDLVNLIERNTNHGAASKSKIFFTACIYREDRPVKVENVNYPSFRGIYINYDNKKYSISYQDAKFETEVIKKLKDARGNLEDMADTYGFDPDAHTVNGNSKKTAEELLSDIFDIS